MSEWISVLNITVNAKLPIRQAQLINFQAQPAKSGEPVLGVAASDAETGEDLCVHCLGVFELKAGANIGAGDWLGSNDFGHVAPSGTKPFARALADASAGEMVRVMTTST